MIKDIKKKSFKLSIPSFKFQIQISKTIFFKGLQKPIEVFLLKMKKFKSRKNKGKSHILLGSKSLEQLANHEHKLV